MNQTRRWWRAGLGVLLAGAVLNACSGEKPTESGPDPAGTKWSTIQQQILTPNCTGACHSPGTAFARQSDLVLTGDVAYDQLVGRAPHNRAAADDGLLLAGTRGLPSLYTSFLWEKINAPDQAHFYDEHPQYGGQMPLGAPSLTNGELALIREWILAGAPREGTVADEALLQDKTRYQPPEFRVPERPRFGVQFHLGPFEVAPHYEREFYFFQPLDTPGDLLVDRVEVSMRPGSHHFIIYTFDPAIPASARPPEETYRDLRDGQGRYIQKNLVALEWSRFMAGTQWPYMNYAFPPGVALRVPHIGGLDLNSHYVNRGADPLPGEVYINLHFARPEEVVHTAELLDLDTRDFALPPHQVTTVERSFAFGETRHIFQLFSHAHEHMTEFRVTAVHLDRSEEVVYFARDWQHPPILELDPPLTLVAGEGLRVAVTYDNDTNRTLRFGLLSEAEMMILFGYYYTD